MENELPTISVQEDARATKRGRIMGKLFGRDRERKVSQEGPPQNNNGDLNDFLRGSSDQLQVAHPGPPMLAKLDTRAATRYPNALNVQGPSDAQQDLAYRTRQLSPRIRKNKGLFVRFVDTNPEIIGNGGDECLVPTAEIARNRRMRPPAVTTNTAPARPAGFGEGQSFRSSPERRTNEEPSTPGPLRRIQTGYSSFSPAPGPVPEMPAGTNIPARHVGSPGATHDERRRSFIEVHQAEMRQAEGLAFANAVRSGSATLQPPGPGPAPHTPEPVTEGTITESPKSIHVQQIHTLLQTPRSGPAVPNASNASNSYFYPHPQEQSRHPQASPSLQHPQEAQPPPSHYLHAQINQHPESPGRLKKTPIHEQSPLSVSSAVSNPSQPYTLLRQGSRISELGMRSPAAQNAFNINDGTATPASVEDAMNAFVSRTRHLFELFRLHSESIRPLRGCSPDEIMRSAFWWFLTGRMALENAAKERPSSPESQKKNDIAKQQAHADIAKAYWLSEEILPDIISNRHSTVSPKIDEACQTLASNLRKLVLSMQRNGFLPAEEAFLPQAIDRSIWVDYPQLTQDLVSLLWGLSSSALGHPPQQTSGMGIVEALPLGDSPLFFCFGRFPVEVFLMEQGANSQRLYLPSFLSTVRSQRKPDLMFVIANQDGSVQLRISGIKGLGPVWEDIRWRPETCTLDVRLPRGFVLVVQCSQPSYKMLWSMYEFSAKIHASLYPKKDEQVLFRSTLRAFQYFDNDPQSRTFPKDSTSGCEVALFERTLREGAATGPRVYHRGYRIAVVTGPGTKTLSGVNQTYNPQTPVQFGFLRNDANDPALSLKFENGRLKGNMVLSFNDEQERVRMHSLLIGTALQNDEHIFCEIPLQGIWLSERFGEMQQPGLKVLSALAWQRARVINHDNDGDRPPCVLADRLRVVYEFQDGTLTDRVNIAPGELRLRLDVRNQSCIMVFRQAQADITVAVTEAKVPRELAPGLCQALEVLQNTPTIRTYMFPTVADLHAFESAITGFKILYDGVASSFAIARRRMVVPIHKKWEAGATRIQIVQQDGATQLLAFFEDFAHGKCMGFNLKGTDVFEAFNRGSKAGLKIDDAKFPLPKVLAAGSDGVQEAADVAFVCLDLPELPGEHDDITMLFDKESERDKLISCLPAPVKGSRLQKIKGLS